MRLGSRLRRLRPALHLASSACEASIATRPSADTAAALGASEAAATAHAAAKPKLTRNLSHAVRVGHRHTESPSVQIHRAAADARPLPPTRPHDRRPAFASADRAVAAPTRPCFRAHRYGLEVPSIDWYLVLVRGGLALLALGPSLLLAMFLLTRGDLERYFEGANTSAKGLTLWPPEIVTGTWLLAYPAALTLPLMLLAFPLDCIDKSRDGLGWADFCGFAATCVFGAITTCGAVTIFFVDWSLFIYFGIGICICWACWADVSKRGFS